MPIVGTKVGKIHYIYNDVDQTTSCKVETYNWWYWQIDITHGNHSEPIVTTEDMFVQNKFIPEGTTTYNQQYSVKLKINDCTVTDSIKPPRISKISICICSASIFLRGVTTK